MWVRNPRVRCRVDISYTIAACRGFLVGPGDAQGVSTVSFANKFDGALAATVMPPPCNHLQEPCIPLYVSSLVLIYHDDVPWTLV